MTRGLSIALVVLAAACSESDVVTCDDGTVCPVGQACGNARQRCVQVAQVEVCAGRDDGDACSYAGVDGVCSDAVCFAIVCGNGWLDPGEVCDDGNRTSGDGCAASCYSDETCGNAVVDAEVGEACDDGNTVDGDGCDADCTLPRG